MPYVGWVFPTSPQKPTLPNSNSIMGNGKIINENWEQNKELQFKLLIELGFKLRLIPIFHFRNISAS